MKTRRSFLKTLAGAAAAVAGHPILDSMALSPAALALQVTNPVVKLGSGFNPLLYRGEWKWVSFPIDKESPC